MTAPFFADAEMTRINKLTSIPAVTLCIPRRWGVRCTLDQAIEAPPLVKAFLVADCRLNTAFAGPVSDVRRFNAATNGKVDLVYTPDERVTVIRGRYHDTRSFKHDAIVPAVALPAGAGAGAAAERQRLLEQKRAIQQARCARCATLCNCNAAQRVRLRAAVRSP